MFPFLFPSLKKLCLKLLVLPYAFSGPRHWSSLRLNFSWGEVLNCEFSFKKCKFIWIMPVYRLCLSRNVSCLNFYVYLYKIQTYTLAVSLLSVGSVVIPPFWGPILGIYTFSFLNQLYLWNCIFVSCFSFFKGTVFDFDFITFTFVHQFFSSGHIFFFLFSWVWSAFYPYTLETDTYTKVLAFFSPNTCI